MDLVDTELEPPHLQRNSAEFKIIGDIAAGSGDGPVLMINMNGYYHDAGYPDGNCIRPTSRVSVRSCRAPGDCCCVGCRSTGKRSVSSMSMRFVFAWYPTHKAFAELYLAPGAEENFRLKGLCVQHHVIHRCPGDRFPIYPHAKPD